MTPPRPLPRSSPETIEIREREGHEETEVYTRTRRPPLNRGHSGLEDTRDVRGPLRVSRKVFMNDSMTVHDTI